MDEQQQFERQLRQRIERGQIVYDAHRVVFCDARDGWDLHPDEQKTLRAWHDAGIIRTMRGQTSNRYNSVMVDELRCD